MPDFTSHTRWQLDSAAIPSLSAPEVAAPAASLSVSELDGRRHSAVPESISEAVRTAFVDGVDVDVQRLPCAPSLDPLLSPVANTLHKIAQIARDNGIHLHGELFSAADAFFVAHDGIANAHWLCGCSLEVVPSTDFNLPVGSILMVLQDELRRVIDNGCTWRALRAAFKNIVARVAPKSGLVFLLKKAGLVIGSALLGTAGALLLGVLGVFAGSWLGAKIGRHLREWSYAIARAQLLLHGRHMGLAIPKYYEDAVQDIGKAVTEQQTQLAKELRRNRLDWYRTLLRLRRDEDKAIDAFLEEVGEIIEYTSAKQRRDLARRESCFEPNPMVRILGPVLRPFGCRTARDRLKALHEEFAAAEERLDSARARLQSGSRVVRLLRVFAWLQEVTVNSARMGRAVDTLIAPIKEIDEQRDTILTGFPATEQAIVQKNAKMLAHVCEGIAKSCLNKVTKETQEADRKIETLQTRGKEIGLTVEVKRTWKSAA